MNSTFIEFSRLGVLDEQIRNITSPTTLKRTRQREFGRLARLLKDLRLIDKQRKIKYLGMCSNAAGEFGLLVTFESPDKEVGVVMPQTPAEVRVCNKTAYCILPEGHLGNCHIAIPT